jgi:prefoldin beta subunit
LEVTELAERISPQVQEQIAQYQNMQQQIQVTAAQKMQLMAKLKEIEMGLKELEKSKDKKIYKSIGMLLIEVNDLEALKKEMDELRETYDLRVKTMEKQEKRLAERFQKLHEQLSKSFGGEQPSDDS